MRGENMKKNWERSAMRFASAHYVDRQGMLEVTFQNGDRFLVAAESVLPREGYTPLQRTEAPPPEWAKMRIAETGDVLEVPALDAVIEIPWDRIRSLADPAFRALLADRADERARRIGERIRIWRREAGLTPTVLAEKLGVPREVVANLEAGKIQPPTGLIEDIALALGKRLRDFAEE
jgi:DNA-binding XRE family transcriptional regulator